LHIRLAYGKTGLDVNLPDGANVTVVEPKYIDGLPDPSGALREALRHSIESPPLRDLVRSTDKVGIVFSDVTRPTPNHLLLPAVLTELGHVPDDSILLVNGTGTHRPNTFAELQGMLGNEIVERYRILQNDSDDLDSHALMGTTSSGNDVWLHREFAHCDVRILTGFIEPHLFAGYSGGGKAVMPGLALLETVLRNHNAANLDNPAACWGVTRGNPLWEEVQEAAAIVEPTFLLNVTLNRDKQITGVFAGDWQEAHKRGCAFVKETAMAPVEDLFDIVVTSNSGYPLDLNVYQSVKGMSAAAQVVKPGGSIVIAADCWDGIPEHGDYVQMLTEAESLESLLAMARDPNCTRQDRWQVHVQALICQKADVHFYSHNLSDEQIESVLFTPCRDIEATVAELLERHGPDASICVLPEGPQTIPYLCGS
jgi:nickel-dependent lactate racemase